MHSNEKVIAPKLLLLESTTDMITNPIMYIRYQSSELMEQIFKRLFAVSQVNMQALKASGCCAFTQHSAMIWKSMRRTRVESRWPRLRSPRGCWHWRENSLPSWCRWWRAPTLTDSWTTTASPASTRTCESTNSALSFKLKVLVGLASDNLFLGIAKKMCVRVTTVAT